jgi:hypothetical protein
MTKTIKWQSYEDYIDEVLKKSRAASGEIYNLSKDDLDDSDDYDGEVVDNMAPGHIPFLLPKTISRDLAISMFHDCWIGHTNFSITEAISRSINSCEGVELLRINGRYTFTVGIGKCFDFKDVRKYIDKSLKIPTKRKKVVNGEIDN